MEFTKEDLNLENGLEKEWLITNGIGYGFCGRYADKILL